MSKGSHPNSLANLQPRSKDYGTEKKERRVTVTQSGWDGATQAIKDAGFSSISQFLEELGRGRAAIAPINEAAKLDITT